MASRKISVNLSGARSLKGVSSKSVGERTPPELIPTKNVGERTPPELIPTNMTTVLNDKKLISDWKSSKEVKFPSRAWYVKERESTTVNIYLYIDTRNNTKNLEVMGKVMDMCSVPNTEVVYVLTKTAKSHERIKYRLSYSFYDRREVSTKLCKQIVNDMTQNTVSIVICIFILRFENVSLYFLTLIILTYDILFGRILLKAVQLWWEAFIT